MRAAPSAERSFADIAAGEVVTDSVDVTREMVEGFAALSGDKSPIHVDAAAARARGFTDQVAHGALLVALVSGIVGTRLPGVRGVLHSIQMKFNNPCCVGRRVTVSVKVIDKIDAVQTLILEATVIDDLGTLLANGKFQSGVRDGSD